MAKTKSESAIEKPIGSWVTLDIDGWRKDIRVPVETMMRGVLEVELGPPMIHVVPPPIPYEVPKQDISSMKVLLHYVGSNTFKYIP